jgi:hypothetical protein
MISDINVHPPQSRQDLTGEPDEIDKDQSAVVRHRYPAGDRKVERQDYTTDRGQDHDLPRGQAFGQRWEEHKDRPGDNERRREEDLTDLLDLKDKSELVK